MSTPIEKPARKRLKWLWIVLGSIVGVFVLLIVIGLIVGPSETEPTSSDATTSTPPEPTAEPTTAPTTTAASSPSTTPAESTPEPTTAAPEVAAIPEPSEEQAQALRTSFAEINPLLDHDGVVDDARNTCQSMLGGIEEANLIRATTLRFTAPGLSEVSEAEAEQIVEVIRTNGFCPTQ